MKNRCYININACLNSSDALGPRGRYCSIFSYNTYYVHLLCSYYLYSFVNHVRCEDSPERKTVFIAQGGQEKKSKQRN